MITKLIITLAVPFGIALVLGARPANAQTMAEFAATTNDAGMLAGQSALADYQSAASSSPSVDGDHGADYQTEELDSSSRFANSTDESTNFSDTTNYAPSEYSTSDFSTSTEYKSVNDYSNPTDMPTVMN